MHHPTPPPRFVRQFALVKGRARSVGADLALEALVQSTDRGVQRQPALGRDQQRVIELCRDPISIAEIGAHLHVHLGIVRVLVSDMVAHDLVALSSSDFDESGPDLGTLERLLDELETL